MSAVPAWNAAGWVSIQYPVMGRGKWTASRSQEPGPGGSNWRSDADDVVTGVLLGSRSLSTGWMTSLRARTAAAHTTHRGPRRRVHRRVAPRQTGSDSDNSDCDA